MQLEPSPTVLPPIEETVASDFVARLHRNRGVVFGCVGLFVALGIYYTLWVPPRWSADSTILLPGARSSGLAGAAAQLGLNTGGDTSLSMFHKVLDSDRLINMVSRQTGYPAKDLRKLRHVDEDTKGNTIAISVVDKDQGKALRINGAMLSSLGVIVNNLMLPSKGRRVATLENSLVNHQKQLAVAEQRLERFNRTAITAPGTLGTVTTGSGPNATSVPTVAAPFRYQDQVTTLETQLESLDARLNANKQKSQQAGAAGVPEFPAFQEWQKQLVEVEGRLGAARASYREDSPEVRRVKKEYDNVRATEQRDIDRYLGAVEQKVTGGTATLDQERQGVLSQIAAIRRLAAAAPSETTTYQRLARDIATLTSLVTQLRLEYEQAKLDSMDDPNRWVILDAPRLADDPVNKNFVRNVGLAAVAGFLLSVPIVGWRDSRRMRRTSPLSES